MDFKHASKTKARWIITGNTLDATNKNKAVQASNLAITKQEDIKAKKRKTKVSSKPTFLPNINSY